MHQDAALRAPCRLARDAINAVLAAAGYNFRRLLAWFALLFAAIWIALIQAGQTEPPYETA